MKSRAIVWSAVACLFAGVGLGCKKKESGGAASPAAAFQAVTAACKAKDSKKYWSLSTRRYHKALGLYARDRRSITKKVLTKVYGYKGDPAKFDAKEYLAAVIHQRISGESPCYQSKSWKKKDKGMQGKHQVYEITREDKQVFQMKFRKFGKGWLLDIVTEPQRVATKEKKKEE